MMRRNVLRAALTVAGLLSLTLASPALASDPPADCDEQTHVAVDSLTSDCSAFAEVVELSPGRNFDVPDEGEAVTFSATTVKGSPVVDDVTVARSDDGFVAVETGDEGEADHHVYGTPSVLDEFNAPPPAAEAPMTTLATPPKCESYEYTIRSYRWLAPLQWRYKTPSFGGQASVSSGFQSMASGTGACGANLPNSAAATYLGTTTVSSSVEADNTCSSGDYNNVVVAGALPIGTLAGTCTYKTTYEIIAADIKFNTAYTWYTGVLTGCTGSRFDLQVVATHEAGHAFGLGHVSAASDQVMKPQSDYCEVGQRKLGNGDLAGMKALYP